MDPLSISMSVVTIIQAASSIVKIIKKIADAPLELRQIAEAANALEASLDDVRRWQEAGSRTLTEGLAFHLRRSEQKLTELECYLQDHGLTEPKKLRSPVFYLRHREKLQCYKTQLSEVRGDITLALAAVNYGQTGQIELELQQLVLFGAATMHTLGAQASKLENLAEKTEEMRRAQAAMAQLLETTRGSHTTSIVRLHHTLQMDKEIPPEDPGQERLASPKFGPPLSQTNMQCSRACRCDCHKKRRIATPHSAREWVGALSITFSGIGPLSSSCTVASCARNLRPSASVDFTLPAWLASNMISIWLKAAPIQGPELLLRSRRIIETPAYYTAEQGQLESLRQLYTEGRAGIHDVNPLSGRNTLFDSIFRGHLHVVRFLLTNGADMEAADFCGFTPRDLAFQRVNTTCPQELAEQLRLLFHLHDAPDDLEFTAAHRIVLGLSPLGSLGDYLMEHPEDVDKMDLLGRTPLWWAVRRDDNEKSLMLLQHGADPSIANSAGRSALHNAAAQGNLVLVEALLDHGADVGQRSFEGKTPLQVVGVYGGREDVLIVKRLLAAGARVDERDGYGRTALSLCCFDSHVNVARVLLDHGGADATVPDAKGWLPWHWAVHDGASRILELYLEQGRGCDLGVPFSNGTTVLHYLAERCVSKDLVDVLIARVGLLASTVDPDSEDALGRTAAMILEERHTADVPIYPLDELLHWKLTRLLALVAEFKDVDPSPPSSAVSTVDSWHSVEYTGESKHD